MACNLYDLLDIETGEIILRGAYGDEVAKAINERLPEKSKITSEKLGYYAQHDFKIRKRFAVEIVGTITTKRKKYTEEDHQGMIDLYNTGESIAGVARDFGCSTNYIRKILRLNHVVTRSPAEHYRKLEKSDKRAAEIRALYPDKKIEDIGKLGALAKAGWKLSAIAEEFGTNTQEVEKCLKALKKKSDFSCTTSI